MTFNMCTQTTGVDCSAVGFAALAVQSGSFGCAIVANWQPVATPPQWDAITNGVQLSVQNGDSCPDGTSRGIQVQFTCDESKVGPASFTASEVRTRSCLPSSVCTLAVGVGGWRAFSVLFLNTCILAVPLISVNRALGAHDRRSFLYSRSASLAHTRYFLSRASSMFNFDLVTLTHTRSQ